MSEHDEILRLLAEEGSISAAEAGAILHAKQGAHSSLDRCGWCHTDGERILRALCRQGKITRCHGGRYRIRRSADQATIATGQLALADELTHAKDPDSWMHELPEGF